MHKVILGGVSMSVVLGALFWSIPIPAVAWGDEGHAVTALVALHFLNPAVRQTVLRVLAEDETGLTDRDIASESSWADRYRDSDRNSSQTRYRKTRAWHYVDIEITRPDLRSACFGFPALPVGVSASEGPADDCVVHKVEEFAAELRDPGTLEAERATALRFLLHFVGDLHQPLHAGENHDKGGNDRRVVGPGLRPANLHQYWDSEFVESLGKDPSAVADELVSEITDEEVHQWQGGDAAAWTLESFEVARRVAYGELPPADPQGLIALTPAYLSDASNAVAEQLSKAGVRLAYLLNEVFSANGHA